MPIPLDETSESSAEPPVLIKKHSLFHKVLYGKPRDINDPSLFHSISLIPFLAWVGLGVDGLSSCAYGPDESFRALFNLPHALGNHPSWPSSWPSPPRSPSPSSRGPTPG